MTGSPEDDKNMESPPNQNTSGDSKGRPGSRVLPQATDTPPSGRSLDRQNSTPKGGMNYGPFFLEYSLLAEYNQLQKQQLPGVYVMPAANSVLLWHGVLFVRQGLYQEGIFRFSLLIPDNYPEGDCPRLLFDPPVFHPLVDPDSGELDVKRAFAKWRKNVNHIWQILLYARRVFYKIDTKNALNQKAAKLYEQDPEMFKKKVSDNVALCKGKIYEPPNSGDPYALRFSHWDPAVHAEQKNKMLSPKSKDIEKSRIEGFSWMLGNRIFEKEKLDL